MKILTDLFTKRPWLAWFWTLLILVACTWPGKDLPAAPMMGFDKIVHVSLFFVWTILWLLVYPQKSTLLVIAGMAYGVGLEFYQQLLPFDRTFDWWDAAADAAGVLVGFVFYWLVFRTYRQRLY
ncbi:VanZ family protein [Dyadobacter luticola]|uniref:VanZ-like domain-containing protein n=1 Tax=Dyadobacter luticola TaxID=1979387 RepID=A0A5R9L409_9BACT|nr:VanZ family protein [Dyadobacter luticola]TLV03141.1 hypothetical protein FEN17_05880 [Dyadobacter luticola]